MKTSELLRLFVTGAVIHENVSLVTVGKDTDLKWLVGAADGSGVMPGEYLVYYQRIEKDYGTAVVPDYTLHDDAGGELYLLRIDEEQRNPVTSFMFYMWNTWSREECAKVFGGGHIGSHLWGKWCAACDRMNGPKGAAEVMYGQLSDANRDRLLARALECYDGMSEKQGRAEP